MASNVTVSNKPSSIAIVGGGIGGLCLAIGLANHQHLRVSIFEAASAFTEIGAGLALGPNAQQALRLLSHAAERAFRNQATANSSPEFSNTWFDFRRGIDGLSLGKMENKTGQQQTVHRAKFLDELAKLIPQGVAHFGKRLARLEETGLSDILLHFTDGTTATADCVIGADGVHSTVRKHLLGAATPAATPVFSGIVAYRGLIPIEVADEVLGEYAHNAYLWCGKGGMVMSYPIDFGRLVNVVAACDGKSWDQGASAVPSTPEQLSQNFEGWGGGAPKNHRGDCSGTDFTLTDFSQAPGQTDALGNAASPPGAAIPFRQHGHHGRRSPCHDPVPRGGCRTSHRRRLGSVHVAWTGAVPTWAWRRPRRIRCRETASDAACCSHQSRCVGIVRRRHRQRRRRQVEQGMGRKNGLDLGH
ncbi:salicylate 1-hydroxylase [Ophiocordyceps sinensis CO18]|uniref:Salicylate 1-hydroxylase n=1 Tax=Ophiocordyceps sinensis (strain Co18 / CGMCC 3.14243) TaxID=911162 RepID=T5AI88_OPHSC|nr:salicylate 1-hydroxylase [Ophiocordyceps sinensis CO18]